MTSDEEMQLIKAFESMAQSLEILAGLVQSNRHSDDTHIRVDNY